MPSSPSSLRQVEEFRPHLAFLEQARLVFDVDAIGAGVLRDDEYLLDAGLRQFLGFAQHVGGRTGYQIAAERRDDAEGAAVVAAFRNLEIGVVARRQLDALRRQKIDERFVRRRGRLVHGGHDALIGLRSGNGEHVGMPFADNVGLGAEASGNDHAAVFGKCRADGVEQLVARRIEEPTGVDDNQIGAVMLSGDFIAFGAQAREDAFGIHKGLRASEADKADAGGRHETLSDRCWKGGAVT